MSDAVFPDGFAVYVDGELGHDLVSYVAGPAGVASVRLDDGVVIEVDYADPEQLVRLQFDEGVPRELIASLIGEERAEAVFSFDEREDGRPHRLVSGRDDYANTSVPRDRPFRSMRPRQGETAQLLSRLAILNTLVADEELPVLVRATASLELARQLRSADTGSPIPLNGLFEPALDRAVVLLAEARDEVRELAASQPRVALELAELCQSLTIHRPVLAEVSARIRQSNEPDDWHELGRRVSGDRYASPSAALRVALSRRDDDQIVALRSLDEAEPRRHLQPVADHTVTLSPRGRLVVSSIRPMPKQWVRVIHARTLTLIALTPMIEDATGNWSAETVVPTDLELDDITVEIQANPLPAVSSLVAVQEAIRLGREAVRATAAGNRFTAEELWHSAVLLWEQVGDDHRARLAREYGMRSMKSQRQHALAERIGNRRAR